MKLSLLLIQALLLADLLPKIAHGQEDMTPTMSDGDTDGDGTMDGDMGDTDGDGDMDGDSDGMDMDGDMDSDGDDRGGLPMGGELDNTGNWPMNISFPSDITACNDDALAVNNATCAAERRVCIVNGTQTCGNCMNGHVDFPEGNCTKIEDLAWETYFEKLSPMYETDADVAERLVRLYIVLRVISYFGSRIPPPPFELTLNAFSGDTAADEKQRLGFFYEKIVSNSTFDFPRWTPAERDLREARLRRNLQIVNIAPAIDWNEAGKVTAVKNQQRCGCCWAVTIAGAVEAAVAINNPGYTPSDLSYQQLISCDTTNLGCGGGNLVYAMGYTWLNDFGGLASDKQYPFTDASGTTTETCAIAGKTLQVAIDDPRVVLDYGDRLSFQERVDTMKAALNLQPVGITLRSACPLISSYGGGILTSDAGCECQMTICIDHAVLMTGYNDESNPPYWIVKNSWGTGWGEQGYFRVSQESAGPGTEWGLFGILGHGIIPLQAVNATGTAGSSDAPASMSPLFSLGAAAVAAVTTLFL